MVIAAKPDLEHVLSRKVTVLGSTGTVGNATLDVIRHAREVYGCAAFPIQALTAQKNVAALAAQALQLKPNLAVIGDASLLPDLRERLAGSGIRATGGHDALVDAARRIAQHDFVLFVALGKIAGRKHVDAGHFQLGRGDRPDITGAGIAGERAPQRLRHLVERRHQDRKSTRLNSSH